MPTPADLVVVNLSSSAITVQGQSIAANGGQYSVGFGAIANWATDPVLRANLLGGSLFIIALGVTLRSNQAAEWMDAIFKGSIVYSS